MASKDIGEYKANTVASNFLDESVFAGSGTWDLTKTPLPTGTSALNNIVPGRIYRQAYSTSGDFSYVLGGNRIWQFGGKIDNNGVNDFMGRSLTGVPGLLDRWRLTGWVAHSGRTLPDATFFENMYDTTDANGFTAFRNLFGRRAEDVNEFNQVRAPGGAVYVARSAGSDGVISRNSVEHWALDGATFPYPVAPLDTVATQTCTRWDFTNEPNKFEIFETGLYLIELRVEYGIADLTSTPGTVEFTTAYVKGERRWYLRKDDNTAQHVCMAANQLETTASALIRSSVNGSSIVFLTKGEKLILGYKAATGTADISFSDVKLSFRRIFNPTANPTDNGTKLSTVFA